MVRKSRAVWWGAAVSLLVGVIAFGSGMAVALMWGGTMPLAGLLGPSSSARQATPGDLRQQFGVYWETWNLVERSFYRKEPLDQQEMVYASIEGMLRSLGDDATVFQRPEQAQQTRVAMSGKWEGIGAYIELKDGQIAIIAPIEESPAERAGLKAGDIILSVDDAELAPLLAEIDPAEATQKAVSLIRGPKGTHVKLHVLRPESGERLEFVITRDALPDISVRARMLDEEVAYIQMSGFNGTTTSQLDKALTTLLPRKPRGIILDLRNNPGGLLTTAREVLGRFLDGGTALYEEFGDGRLDEMPVLRSAGDPLVSDVPVIVLQNGGSASASEIVAGALRDRRRAALVGEKSYGKGSVQSVEQLSDDSSARITTAHWLTPSRMEIHKLGLTPDYLVAPSDDARYKVSIPKVLPNDPETVNDAQLWWAIEMLTGGRRPPIEASVVSPTATP